MMTVGDVEQYRRHRAFRDLEPRSWVRTLWLPIVLFGCTGALSWAIRGTDGWDGIDGTMVPGLIWGLLWYYVCQRKGIDARGVVLWLGMGLALGGELGYGQYVSWIQGKFNAGDGIIPVDAWVGHAWFLICGIAKAMPGGILLGWALHGRVSRYAWGIRVTLVAVLLVILFNLGSSVLGTGIVEWLGEGIARHCPWLIFPNSEVVRYAGAVEGPLASTIYTNTQNFAVLVWGLAALLVAVLQRDRTTLMAGAVIGIAYGPGYLLSALWCLGYRYAPGYVDWWKVWELHAGFNLGVLYVILLQWALRQVDRAHTPEGTPLDRAEGQQLAATFAEEWRVTAFLAFSGFALVIVAGYEYFFWTALLLALFYVLLLVYATWSAKDFGGPGSAADRRRDVTLVFSAFLLVFRLLQGVTSRGGIVLGLYAPEAVDQYAWPAARILIFLPPAGLLIVVTLLHLKRMLGMPAVAGSRRGHLPERMVDLLTFIGFVGATSIWPDKIAVLYAAFLCFAVFALTRLNRHFDEVDS